MTQMRFVAKKQRKLEDNFYVRSDGTRTYFFDLERVRGLVEEAGGFDIAELEYDTRELRNRKRLISMYRVWIRAKFVKSAHESSRSDVPAKEDNKEDLPS